MLGNIKKIVQLLVVDGRLVAISFLLLMLPALAFAEVATLQDFGLQDEWYAGIMAYSWPLMSFVLGLIDGFNPCAMWTLFILLGFLLPMEDSRKRWLIGSVFIGSSAIIYLAALFGYVYGFKIISEVAASAMGWVFPVVGALAVIAGFFALINAKDKGIECDVQDASQKKAFHQKLGKILAYEKIWAVLAGVVFLAFSVNALELLCSIAIPTIFASTIVSLSMPTWQEVSAILIYDFAYILDDLIVFTIAIKTLSLKVFSPRLVQVSNFIGGVVLVMLGLLLIFDSSTVAGWFA